MAQLDLVTARETVLEAYRYGLTQELDRHQFGRLDVTTFELAEHMGRSAALQLRATIYGRQYEGQEIRYPATWWDAFKVRWFVGWLAFLLRRFPATWVVVTPRTRELFPDVPVPVPRQRCIRYAWFDEPRTRITRAEAGGSQ